MTKHDIEIRRFLAWRKKIRGKPITIRLYEIIYVGLVMLWSNMNRPPLRTVIHEFIKRKEYREELMTGKLFQKLIREIMETSCDDGTGFYLLDSNERLTHKDLEKLKKEKNSIMEELITSNIVERYSTIFRFCELYQSWALEKKLQQTEDITKQENFEINPGLPLNIIQ